MKLRIPFVSLAGGEVLVGRVVLGEAIDGVVGEVHVAVVQ